MFRSSVFFAKIAASLSDFDLTRLPANEHVGNSTLSSLFESSTSISSSVPTLTSSSSGVSMLDVELKILMKLL